MKAVTEIMGKMAGKRGYMKDVAENGATSMEVWVNDLTDSQAKLLDIVANDEIMVSLNELAFGRYEEIKNEHPELNAEPWYD